MKKIILTLLALAAITAHGQELITNGDFETDVVSSGAFTYISDGGNSITGWTLVMGDVDLVGEGVTMSWAGTTASQCVDLNGLGSGRIEQTVATTATSDYLVTFKYSWNKDGSISAYDNAKMLLRVSVRTAANQEIERLTVRPLGVRFANEGTTVTNDAPVSHSAGWTETNFTFTATTESAHKILFDGMRDRASGGPLIDDVSVTAVP